MFLPNATNPLEQPASRPVINWSHPLARGLIVSLYNAPEDATLPPRNYVNNKIGTGRNVTRGAPATAKAEGGAWLGGGSGHAIAGQGVGSGPITRITGPAKFNGTTSWAQLPLDLSPWSQITIAFWYKRTATTSTVSIEYSANSNTANGFIVGPQSSSTAHMICGNGSGGATDFQSINAQIPLNEWHHHLLTIDRTNAANSSLIVAWNIDGTFTDTTNVGTPLTATGFVANGNLNFGARNGGASAFGSMEIAGVHLWNRMLAKPEQAAVYREGWAMFQPVRNPLMPFLAAAGAVAANRWFLMQ